MTRKIYSGFQNFIPANTNAKTLHTGPGKIRAIVATSSSATASGLTFFDGANTLLALLVCSASPVLLFYPIEIPLVFNTGLSVTSGADVRAHVITEA